MIVEGRKLKMAHASIPIEVYQLLSPSTSPLYNFPYSLSRSIYTYLGAFFLPFAPKNQLPFFLVGRLDKDWNRLF
jgi:hypothetical protein